MADECKIYNDVYEKPPEKDSERKLSDHDLELLNERNKANAKLYRASVKVLKDDFGIVLPQEPTQFPGTLTGNELARAVAVLGIIHADNWQDPSNGKTIANSDDFIADDKTVIDRRFIDAVVDAVKEYTAQSALYNNVFKLMSAEAAEGSASAPPAQKSK
ncbi:MAG: hypothetical protein QM831_26955 [Kofleriaceae bacterium]